MTQGDANTNTQPPHLQSIVHETTISAKESKITTVSLYTGRAEVTREVKVLVKIGQNKVIVTGLPGCMDSASMRVQGRGSGTIQGVIVSRIPSPPTVKTSPALEIINEKQDKVKSAILRAEKARDAVFKYLDTVNAECVEATDLTMILDAGETNLERLDLKIAGLKKEANEVEQKIVDEKNRLNPGTSNLLNLQVQIGVFTDTESEIILALKYAVRNTSWRAVYDVRVNTQKNEFPVKVVYQASIKQITGEDWCEVPILLETNSPTYGQYLPKLHTCSIAVRERREQPKGASRGGQFAARLVKPVVFSEDSVQDESGTFMALSRPIMERPIATVQNTGAIGTTYEIPGLVTITSDGKEHNNTIMELDLNAVLSWATVPKLDTRVYLQIDTLILFQAKIKNASEYILLHGNADIYIDGTFISKTSLMLTNPQEVFNISLGVDPAIRIIYPPRSEESSQSGIITKTSTKVTTQHIKIQNTKLTAIYKLVVVDGIPVSKDARISVKLKTPDLALPSIGTTASTLRPARDVSITSSGKDLEGLGQWSKSRKKENLKPTTVIAQWSGADDESVQVDTLGQDGKINWIISNLGSMEVVNLVLSWEVGVQEGIEVLTTQTSSSEI